MKVPRLGVQSELQLPPVYATAVATLDPSQHSSRQCRILNPPSKARDQTRILMVPSWFIPTEAQWELLRVFLITIVFQALMLWTISCYQKSNFMFTYFYFGVGEKELRAWGRVGLYRIPRTRTRQI